MLGSLLITIWIIFGIMIGITISRIKKGLFPHKSKNDSETIKPGSKKTFWLNLIEKRNYG